MVGRLPGSPRTRAAAFLLLTAVCALIVYRYVNLTPTVEGAFFFSSDDPQVQADREIHRIFPTQAQLIISVAAPDIRSPAYGSRIQAFALELMALPDVISVKDIRHGPDNLQDAFDSPLWRRLLISDDGRSTNLIVTLTAENSAETIPPMEKLIAKYESEDFRIAVSGIPYVVEQIRRHSARDLRIFSAASLVLFSLLLALIYRSLPLVVGTVTACVLAALLTLIVQGFTRLDPGVLLANVGTIVFVLALSHIVFLVANWREAARENPTGGDWVAEALRRTGPASFWAMVTTLLGFLSLFLAEARPLRQFGLSVAVGALIAIGCAYLVFPSFLELAAPRRKERAPGLVTEGRRLLAHRHKWLLPLCGSLVLLGFLGLPQLNTDPSLLSFFAAGSPLRQGLERIDRSGGSSPLDLVVRDPHGAKLNTGKAFERLWALQQELERDPAVGVVMSLPVLLAEADRAPLSFLLT
ncbi:MAG: MMPL family transporter [Acidobacteria bacterium]|nr:MMPL family transporter [Acidobacteriota bacterium]